MVETGATRISGLQALVLQVGRFYVSHFPVLLSDLLRPNRVREYKQRAFTKLEFPPVCGVFGSLLGKAKPFEIVLERRVAVTLVKSSSAVVKFNQ